MADRKRHPLNHFLPAAPTRQLSGWRKHLDFFLRKLGPTWRSAPLRRLIQAACLLLFLDLFFRVAWPYAEAFSSTLLVDKEFLPLESFLWIDPLVGFSTALAARCWNAAVLGAAIILLLCLLFPRGFCGYLCPLGTLIDAFDWMVSKRLTRFRIQTIGRWVHLRYYLLLAVLVSSAFGVLLSGYVAAIPVLTRGLLFTAGRLQLGLLKNWGVVPAANAAIYLSVILFLAIFLLGLLHPRFWCRYVCPSGAVFSLFNFFRIGQRQVTNACIRCNQCAHICPFDAIQENFTTRTAECTYCQTCGGVCPTGAIHFATRWNQHDLKPKNDHPLTPRPLSRRGFVLSILGGAAAATATRHAAAASTPLLRPPGSLSEPQFLDLCIRCGECFKVCPGPVLHPAGLKNGLEALWTPVAIPSHAGCHQDCNFCTQVCPTGAIRPLTLEQKRQFHMGLAMIDTTVCLPHRGERDCQLCYDECEAAGYHAIHMRPIKLAIGPVPDGALSQVELEEMARINAPFVDAQACVGCGLCEYRCHGAVLKQQKLIPRTAIVVFAAPPGN
jgi:ferredoxin